MKKIPILLFVLLTLSCSILGKSKNDTSEDSVEPKKKRIAINASERARQYADNEGGLMKALRGDKRSTFNFATSNPLWRASIISLEDFPLSTVDYAGGVLVTDWYSSGGLDSIKININFTSNELSANSVNVNSFKKVCDKIGNCKIEKVNSEFNSRIKRKIIAKAIELNLQDKKKKK